MAGLARHQQELLDRFVEAARADDRLTGVALVGSHAAGTADTHSDIDLFLVTEDEHLDEFVASRDEFLASLGEVLFVQSWGRPECWFFTFASGAHGDLTVCSASAIRDTMKAPFVVLLDKRGVLEGVPTEPFVSSTGSPRADFIGEQLTDFWHDFNHCLTAIARGQTWWANGQLEVLRGMCVNLLRLAADASDHEAGQEPYWKIDLALPAGQLARIAPTLNTLERASMVRAAKALAALYRELGVPLAGGHGIAYPDKLESLMLGRLAEVDSS